MQGKEKQMSCKVQLSLKYPVYSAPWYWQFLQPCLEMENVYKNIWKAKDILNV